MSPTSRVVALVGAIAVGAFLVPAAAVVVALGVLAAVLAVDAWFARRPVGLQRAVPRVLVLGQPATLRVTVSGVDDGTRVRLRQPRTADLRVETGEADGELTTAVVPLRRGRHVLPPVAARRLGPLGLARWDFRGDSDATVHVYPDVPGARRIAHSVRTGKFRDSAGTRRGPIGLGTEFESIRDYLPDDDVRQVNWAATLRTRSPKSNVYRVETEREVVCLLDCGRLMAAPVGDRTRLDAAMDALTAVVHVADALDDRCGAIAFDDHVIRTLRVGRRNADAIVQSVHDLEPRLVDSDFDLAFRMVRNTKRSLVIVFTDLLDPAAARALVDAVPVLTRRHAVVVVSASDPDLDAARTAPHADDGLSVSMARAVVATELLDARAATVRRLTAVGARVVEAPCSALPVACVAAYLRLKDAARL